MKTFGFSQPHPSEVVSGDAWLTFTSEGRLRVALVDGAGHGEPAALAASIALQSLGESCGDPLAAALARCHKDLHGSRGAAVSVVEIDGDKLHFAGVGNVECRVLAPSHEHRLTPQRGIAGVVLPTLRPLTVALESPEWAVIMTSDGVSQRFRADWQAIVASPGQYVVDAVKQWGRLTDDATAVLIVSSQVRGG